MFIALIVCIYGTATKTVSVGISGLLLLLLLYGIVRKFAYKDHKSQSVQASEEGQIFIVKLDVLPDGVNPRVMYPDKDKDIVTFIPLSKGCMEVKVQSGSGWMSVDEQSFFLRSFLQKYEADIVRIFEITPKECLHYGGELVVDETFEDVLKHMCLTATQDGVAWLYSPHLESHQVPWECDDDSDQMLKIHCSESSEEIVKKLAEVCQYYRSVDDQIEWEE